MDQLREVAALVSICDSVVTPVDSIKVLGTKFDRGLGSDPHVRKLTSALASMAGLARCLKIHLPTDLVADNVKALLVGKVGYCVAAVLHPRLNQDALCSSLMAALQVRVNDGARVICGLSQSDQRTVADLLKSSGLPLVNRLTIKSVTVEGLKSLGPHGNAITHPLTSIFGPPVTSSTRAGDNGLRKPATRFPVRSFVDLATLVWNLSHQQRSAPTVGVTKRVATSFAEACPIYIPLACQLATSSAYFTQFIARIFS